MTKESKYALNYYQNVDLLLLQLYFFIEVFNYPDKWIL